MMSSNGFTKDLLAFFKSARHLWGRCPHCDQPFRLSDAAISPSPNPPRDWLRRLERQQATLDEQERIIANREIDLRSKEIELDQIEDALGDRECRLERDAKQRVREILKSNTEVQGLIRAASKDAVKRSRATLLAPYPSFLPA